MKVFFSANKRVEDLVSYVTDDSKLATKVHDRAQGNSPPSSWLSFLIMRDNKSLLRGATKSHLSSCGWVYLSSQTDPLSGSQCMAGGDFTRRHGRSPAFEPPVFLYFQTPMSYFLARRVFGSGDYSDTNVRTLNFSAITRKAKKMTPNPVWITGSSTNGGRRRKPKRTGSQANGWPRCSPNPWTMTSVTTRGSVSRSRSRRTERSPRSARSAGRYSGHAAGAAARRPRRA